MIRDEFVKTEIEEFNSVGKQIIPSKTKYSSLRQYNLKKPKKGGFNNLVCASISCFVYDIFAQNGENSAELDDGKFGH